MKRVLLAAAVAAMAASSFVVSGEKAAAQGCGTYIILGCFQDWNAAESRRQSVGAQWVLDTDVYSNFRNGWFCVADGPWQGGWQNQLQDYKVHVPDAYAKSAC